MQALWKPSLVVGNLRDEEVEISAQFWLEASGKVWVKYNHYNEEFEAKEGVLDWEAGCCPG